MLEKNHVLNLLKKAKKGIKKRNSMLLRNLSNQTIHSASIEQDASYIIVAVILYSLSKIVERENYKKYKEYNNFLNYASESLEKAIFFLKKEKYENFYVELKNIIDQIKNLEKNFRDHLEQVFKKANINKASRLYEHGISMSKTAELLGITLFELAEYAGTTKIGDVELGITLPVIERIKIAEDIFEK